MAVTLDITPRRLLQVSITFKPDSSITGDGGVDFDGSDLPFDEADIAFDED